VRQTEDAKSGKLSLQCMALLVVTHRSMTKVVARALPTFGTKTQLFEVVYGNHITRWHHLAPFQCQS
jgi:hypothetical protein